MAAKAGLAYVAIIPRDYLITLPSGTAIRADEAVKDAVFERRSCENGSKGPRYSDRAMTATSPADDHPASTPAGDSDVSDTDLQIPLGDAPVPARGGQPAHPPSPPSNCPSPRPPGSPASPPLTPPG